MLLIILFAHFLHGGVFPLVLNKTKDAIVEFKRYNNWLYTGYVYSYDYLQLRRRLFYCCVVAIGYLVSYAILIYSSVRLLTLA